MKLSSSNVHFKSSASVIIVVLLIILSACNRSAVKQQKKAVAAETKITNAEKLGFPAGKKVILLHCDDAGMCDEANIAVQHYFRSANNI